MIPKKQKRKIILYSITTVLLMIIIFLFSSQSAQESEQSSNIILRMMEHLFENILPEDTLTFLIRKSAHMFIYFLLGCSVSLLAQQIFQLDILEQLAGWQRRIASAAGSIAVSFLYACSDEWHQTFVPGRSGALRDVGIDAIGFTTAVLLIHLLAHRKTPSSS